MNDLLKTADCPGMSATVYKQHERIIGPIIEEVAKESCLQAAAIERALTEKSVEESKKLL